MPRKPVKAQHSHYVWCMRGLLDISQPKDPRTTGSPAVLTRGYSVGLTSALKLGGRGSIWTYKNASTQCIKHPCFLSSPPKGCFPEVVLCSRHAVSQIHKKASTTLPWIPTSTQCVDCSVTRVQLIPPHSASFGPQLRARLSSCEGKDQLRKGGDGVHSLKNVSLKYDMVWRLDAWLHVPQDRQTLSPQKQGEGTDGETPAYCSCSETGMLLLTRSPGLTWWGR